MNNTNNTMRRNQEKEKPAVNTTLLSVRNNELVAMSQNNQNQPPSKIANNTNNVARNPQRLQQAPGGHQDLRATADDIPSPDTWPPYEQANRALFASIKTTDAGLQQTSARQARIAFVEMKLSAAIGFGSDKYDHMIAGRELHPFKAGSSIDEALGGGLGGMEEDEDFESFVREARFVEGREGREAGRSDAMAVVRYADQREK